MKRSLVFTISTVVILVAVVVWVCVPASFGDSDAANYQRWKHIPRLYKRAVWWNKHLPQGLAHAIRVSSLPQQYISEREKLEAALVGSGYLTNVTIAAAPTNSAQVNATIARIQRACQGRDEWNVSLRPNALVITCRPQDELQCRKALEE